MINAVVFLSEQTSTRRSRNDHEDELKLIGEMKEAASFTSKIGRSYDQFSTIMAPTHSTLNEEGYIAWIIKLSQDKNAV